MSLGLKSQGAGVRILPDKPIRNSLMRFASSKPPYDLAIIAVAPNCL